MMIRECSATALLLTLTLMPVSTAAYVTPEEELDDRTYTTRFYDPPPSTRTTSERTAEQQRVSAERRDAELNAAKPQPEPAEDETMHDAAPAEEQSDLDKMIELMKLMQNNPSSGQPASDNDARASLDPVTQRLLIRAEAQSAAAERASLLQSLMGESGNALHSGAPLADTGPATALIILAIAGAIGETWRRVRKAQTPASPY